MPGPTITLPAVPVLGLPPGEKDAGQRVDMKPSKFELVIENKGYLLAWTRACVCPCQPVTDKSTQPDPNCTLCHGQGWFYFGGNQSQDLSAYNLDAIQQKIVADSQAMLIRGILTNIGNRQNTLEKTGNWVEGTMNLTVRHQNKLGLYDKIVVLAPEIVYSQVYTADGGSSVEIGRSSNQIRYRMTGINQAYGHVPEAAAPVAYVADSDYELSEEGELAWLPGKAPISGTRVALHYTCHPTFLVIEHPHVVRTTLKKFKKAPEVLTTPMGDAEPLPIQALVRYDFLP